MMTCEEIYFSVNGIVTGLGWESGLLTKCTLLLALWNKSQITEVIFENKQC